MERCDRWVNTYFREGFMLIVPQGFVPPYALQRILSALQEGTEKSKGEAFFSAFMTVLANLSFAQVDLFQGWHSRRCYERTRGQVNALILMIAMS